MIPGQLYGLPATSSRCVAVAVLDEIFFFQASKAVLHTLAKMDLNVKSTSEEKLIASKCSFNE